MVSGNTDTIKLELIVDRDALQQQLSTVFGTSLGPTEGGIPAGVGVGSGKNKKPAKVDLGQQASKQLGNLARLTGISLGITALVKSSKVAQTTLGAMQSVLGAVVDSFLAPLVPLLIPLITGTTKLVEPAMKAGERAADFLGEIKQDIGTTLPYMLGAEKPEDYPDDVSRMGLWKEMGQTLWENFKQNSPMMNPNYMDRYGMGRDQLMERMQNKGGEGGLEINVNVAPVNDKDAIINEVLRELEHQIPGRDTRSRGFGGG